MFNLWILDSASLTTQSHYPPVIPARGDNEGGSTTNTPRPMAGPVRSGTSGIRRIAPYEPPRVRPTLRLKAGAGPSNLPSHVRPVGQPTVQPTGGQSETTANAKTNKPNAEEDEVPVSHVHPSHILRASDWLFGVRRRNGRGPHIGVNHLGCQSSGPRKKTACWWNGRGSKTTFRNLCGLMMPSRVSNTFYSAK